MSNDVIIFPNDENGDVLRRMQAGGDDLSRPRNIDFFFAFETERQAREFAAQAAALPGLQADASPYEERQRWQVCVTRNMVPSHAEITALEQSLCRLADTCQGEPEGWGCMQVD